MPIATYKKQVNVPELLPAEIAAQESILKTLAYFDIFNYPLAKADIAQFLDHEITDRLLESSLQNLLENHNIFLCSNLYSLQNNPLLAHRRKQGNAKAARLLPKAIKNGKFLLKFPFVKAVAVSGSLSKNFADSKADIDFFIITKNNRLWIARTIMHLFKKMTFLTGRQHLYCMNYYIDESALQLTDQNIFTAVEIKTLLPIGGAQTMNDFFAANGWADDLLPACTPREIQLPDRKPSFFRKMIEEMLNAIGGERLDNYLFRKTSARWLQKKVKGKRNDKGQTMGLVTGKHFARSNPGAFQEKVLSLYAEKVRGL